MRQKNKGVFFKVKGSGVLRTLRFIFFTVLLFVLTLSAVMVTILIIYTPTYRAKVNDKIVGYFKTEAEFDEIFDVISNEKKADGMCNGSNGSNSNDDSNCNGR